MELTIQYTLTQCFVCHGALASCAEIAALRWRDALCWTCVAALAGGIHLGRDAPRTDVPSPNAHIFLGTNATTAVSWFVPDECTQQRERSSTHMATTITLDTCKLEIAWQDHNVLHVRILKPAPGGVGYPEELVTERYLLSGGELDPFLAAIAARPA